VTGATITHNQSTTCPTTASTSAGLGHQRPRRQPGLRQPGTYNYQPIYTTPTTLKNDTVAYN